MNITITHTEYDEEDNEIETELFIDATYIPGEEDEPWGYYDATPGYDSDVEITSVTELMFVEGPHQNPYAGRYELVKDVPDEHWYNKTIIKNYNSYKCPNYPVAYKIPWEGELSESEIDNIIRICERGEDDARCEDAAINAYESRRDSRY